jgi:hypothetical protein
MTKRRLPASKAVNQGGALDGAAIDLLGRLPLRWRAIDVDAMASAEQEALKLLTAGGLVERRLSFRLSLIGHPVRVEATVTATGEYGLVEAMEPVAKAAWQAWAGEYLRGKTGVPQDQPTFHSERTGPEQIRLTQHGQQAQADVEGGQARMVLDFLHKRTLAFAGKVVRGHGQAEKVKTQAAPVAPVQVELIDTGPMAAIAELMQKWFEAHAKALPTDRPDDLVTCEIAVSEYHTSRSTIRRKVKAGELRDHRPPGSPANAKLLLSRAELDRLFARKK